jgi:putative RNA 2'-phosphotransferase
MSKDPLVHRSKHLSLVLRHDPGSVGLTLDGAGWVEVAKLLPAMKFTRQQLDEVVKENNKKRFEFSSDGLKIRASQGHSVEVDLGYQEQEPPERLYHGTSGDLLKVLLVEGLKPMDRHDVHLSASVEDARAVAKRRRNPVILEILADTMTKDGFKFRLSTNGVWLTEHVPPKYCSVLEKWEPTNKAPGC